MGAECCAFWTLRLRARWRRPVRFAGAGAAVVSLVHPSGFDQFCSLVSRGPGFMGSLHTEAFPCQRVSTVLAAGVLDDSPVARPLPCSFPHPRQQSQSLGEGAKFSLTPFQLLWGGLQPLHPPSFCCCGSLMISVLLELLVEIQLFHFGCSLEGRESRVSSLRHFTPRALGRVEAWLFYAEEIRWGLWEEAQGDTCSYNQNDHSNSALLRSF